MNEVSMASDVSKSPVGVAVVGCGYWGPNLIRNFSAGPASRVVALCDQNEATLNRVGALAPTARKTRDFLTLLTDPAVEAIAIATPVGTHAALATAALEAGKHVLVEKPITSSSAEARIVIAEAARRNLVLMVDHTFVYTPAVMKIRQLVEDDSLGQIYYYDSTRVNLGLFQSDVNVIWDLAVHDFSILEYLIDQKPTAISACGSRHIALCRCHGLACADYGGTNSARRHRIDSGDGWCVPVCLAVRPAGRCYGDRDLQQ